LQDLKYFSRQVFIEMIGELPGSDMIIFRKHFHQVIAAFLEALPGEYRYALEFRDPSWLNQEAYRLLTDHGVAFCIYEFAGQLSPQEVTASFVYIRLHGPRGPYQGNYEAQTLAGWAGEISAWTSQGKEVFCYFDNDEAGYAPQNALSLKKLLSRE
jgi:uncharacterized protein YecE (DUF72 family)